MNLNNFVEWVRRAEGDEKAEAVRKILTDPNAPRAFGQELDPVWVAEAIDEPPQHSPIPRFPC